MVYISCVYESNNGSLQFAHVSLLRETRYRVTGLTNVNHFFFLFSNNFSLRHTCYVWAGACRHSRRLYANTYLQNTFLGTCAGVCS